MNCFLSHPALLSFTEPLAFAVFILNQLTHTIGHHSAWQRPSTKTLMTHLSQSDRQPQQYTFTPKIDDEMHNNLQPSSNKSQRLQNRVYRVLKEDTLGPNVCYANLMMESFRGPIHRQTQRTTSTAHLVFNVLCDPG